MIKANLFPLQLVARSSLSRTKIFLVFLYAILFGVLFFPESKKVSETILWVNIFTLLPTLLFINWEERVEPLLSSFVLVRAVFIQAAMQMVIYLYWGKYNSAVIDRIPLLIHQIAFGYVFQFNLCMFSGKKCAFSFSTMAAIVSANLFIWFAHKVYFFHYLLIGSAITLKMLLTRKVNGEDRHIFNPSGLVSFLAVAAILLYKIPDDFSDYFYGPQIGAFWLWLPHFDLVVLICSCITLWTPNLYVIPLSSVAFFVFGDMCTRYFLSMDLIEESGKGAVFLGITFLITDPSTAPKTRVGQMLYGVSYSLAVCLGFSVLVTNYSLLYFKKVLFIVVVNLMVPVFDKIALKLERLTFDLSKLLEGFTRGRWLCIYLIFFFVTFNYFERGSIPPYFFDFSGNLSGQNLPPEMKARHEAFLKNNPRSEFWRDLRPGFNLGSRVFFSNQIRSRREFEMEGNAFTRRSFDLWIIMKNFYLGIVDEFNFSETCRRFKNNSMAPGEFINPRLCEHPPGPFKRNPDFERF